MDGIAQVQARIASIQANFAAMGAGPVMSAGSATATSGTGQTTSESFADTLTKVQAAGSTGTATGAAETAGLAPGSAEQRAVAQARKYLGIPYVWGGTNPDVGMDCSGLTQRVYKDLGYDIPRVSYEQAKAGRPVGSVDQARPGDLVFYDYSSSRPGIDHVAMYIGDGKIIEAARPGTDIRVSDVGNPTTIRRILPETSAAPAAAPAPAAAAVAAAGIPDGTGKLAGVPFGDLFAKAGAQFGVPGTLLAAVAKTESGFNPRAVSPAGARGLMQFMPGTAADLGIDPLNPAQAINGAARYLGAHLREFGSVDLALAAYNAGPGAVRKYNGIPPYEETQNYVTKVTDAWKATR